MDGPFLYDFGAYYNAAVRVVHGVPLYEPGGDIPGSVDRMSKGMPWLYPPIFVLLFVPFVVLPPSTAAVLWLLLVVGFECAAAVYLVRAHSSDLSRRAMLLIIGLVVSFSPTVAWILAGQISGLLSAGFCVAAGVLFDEDRSESVSGALAAALALVKPFYAPGGLFTIRHRRRLGGAVLGGCIVLGTSLLLFGVDSHLAYLEVLNEGKGWGASLEPPGQWNTNTYHPLYLLGPYRQIARFAILTAVFGVGLLGVRRGCDDEYLLAFGLAVVPIAGPTTNVFALNALVPVFLLVGLSEWMTRRQLSVPLLASLVLVNAQPLTVEFFGKFSTSHALPTAALSPLLPLLQPALLGNVLLLLLVGSRILSPPTTELVNDC